MRMHIDISLSTPYHVARFQGGVYWGELAEICGKISRKYGICKTLYCIILQYTLSLTLCMFLSHSQNLTEKYKAVNIINTG